MASLPYDTQGRTALVTGATSGIGYETALGLARSGATVLMVARDRARGEQAAQKVRGKCPSSVVELFVADLASQRDVRDLAAQVQHRHDRLDVLVHNAGVVNPVRRVTAEGIETTLAVNHLAPFLLTELLAPLLAAAAPARIVTVSSYMHTRVKHVPWDDLQSEHRYNAAATYNLTKLMNVLFTYELARRWDKRGITANVLHPGWPLKTNLGREQTGAAGLLDRASKLVGASAPKGAQTSLYLSCSPEVAAITGCYFTRCKPTKSSPLSRDPAAASRLWDASAAFCALAAA
jgi:NAD(P)-dependent dehydrogenase (short-subunit alcohol dehydrogenase family)